MSNTILSQQFSEALVYTAELHREQRRKISGVPYLTHLLSVAALVLEDGGDEDEAIAGLLHDAIEDQGGIPTREVIRQKFGDRVVEIIAGCTEWDCPPKPPWKERKLKYLAQLRTASESVRRVSLADKLHNLRSLLMDRQKIGERVWESFGAGRSEMLWFYHELVKLYGSDGLGAAFAQAVAELEQPVDF
ncbi:MAG: HD domain-containing protein [Elainella sp. Prado103]|jgi:(p)ppGpp synthase/HD superfamily hydrolase|nr:HD domain-containing protein [Elainella sp. Prado103]